MSDPSAARADGNDESETTPMDDTVMNDTVMHKTEIERAPFTAPADRPRVRWAGIVWGVAIAAAATAGVVLTQSPNAYATLVEWVAAPSVPALVAAALLTVGVLILIAGVAGMLSRGQRRLPARRAASAATPSPLERPERHTT
ncbi:hypothetical protein [Microbacterium sp. AG238]|uniref:hypothetical protein n=1 Tax=Microbacterium sp. AG238 TaxID=2183994 RepID=UPI000E711127|nr:hypothetical protein [Microbacterium sp. AG238]RKE59970.1 hypothetical protein DEU36_2401 [Microbacterium sp. AG238]